jgi:two-component system, OmpR family, alkaline phosphatase synthesis response regulator PhoP
MKDLSMDNLNNIRILAVDDEEDLLELIKYNLIKEGFSVLTATSGEEAVKLALREKPDLMLLDLMLPGLNGYEVCRLLKNNSETQSILIIMLTARNSESDELRGLELGADDYITKPFRNKILIARVKNTLKKKLVAIPHEETLSFKELSVNPDRREVSVGADKIELTETEFRILYLFSKQPGLVFSRVQIVDSARGEDYPVTDRSVDVHIVSLRKKLGEYGKIIKTIRGVGYKMDLTEMP